MKILSAINWNKNRITTAVFIVVFTAFCNPAFSDNFPIQYQEQLQPAFQKEQEQKFTEAFYSAKTVLDNMLSDGIFDFFVVDETLRLAARAIFAEMGGYNNPLAEKLCREQIDLLKRLGGVDKVISLYRQNSSLELQGQIDNRILAGNLLHFYLLIGQGNFSEIEQDLRVLEKYSPIEMVNRQENLQQFKKLFLEDTDLVPLYEEFSKAGFDFQSALFMTNKLAELFRKIRVTEPSDMRAVINDLKGGSTVFITDLVNIFGEKAENDISESPHLGVLLTLLGGEQAENDWRSALKSNVKLASVIPLFECNYGNFIAYFILKAKGIKVELAQTGKVKLKLSFLDQSLERIGIKSNKKIRVNHIFNLAHFDDKFILVDLGNEYVSESYAFSDLISISDKKFTFFSDKEFVKDFEVWNTGEALAGIFFNFASMFSNIEQYDTALFYLQQAIGLKPDYGDAYASAGEIMYFQNEFDEAKKLSQEALLYNSDSWLAYLTLLRVSFAKHDCDSAFDYAKKCIDQEPDIPIAYEFLGYLFQECSRDTVKARESLKKACSMAEKNGDKYYANELKMRLQQIK